MQPEHEGTININVNGERAEIEVQDGKSGVYAFTLEMSALDLINAIARKGHAPVRFWLNTSGLVGADREHKTVMVPFDCYAGKHPQDTNSDGYRTPDAVKALAPFEVDGWRGEARDMWNGHNRVNDHTTDGTVYQKVRFARFLRVDVPIVRER